MLDAEKQRSLGSPYPADKSGSLPAVWPDARPSPRYMGNRAACSGGVLLFDAMGRTRDQEGFLCFGAWVSDQDSQGLGLVTALSG